MCLSVPAPPLPPDPQHGVQLQTHPNVDKQLFGQQSVIALKQEGKSFPLNSDVGVLKVGREGRGEGERGI